MSRRLFSSTAGIVDNCTSRARIASQRTMPSPSIMRVRRWYHAVARVIPRNGTSPRSNIVAFIPVVSFGLNGQT